MTEADIFGDSDERPEPAAPPLVPGPDYGEIDYLMLPDCGRSHYSLEDAALLGALDWWLADQIPEFPLGDRSSHDEAEPEVRKGIAPTQAKILDVLRRSVDGGHLEAEVFGREIASSKPLPDRTFVHLDDLITCLEQHGHFRGDYLAELQQSENEDLQMVAASRAQERAEFRHAIIRNLNHTAGPAKQSAEAMETGFLKNELHAKDLHIAHLQSQLAGGRIVSARPLPNKEKATLLSIIAVLCKEANLDYSKASKTANLLQDTAAKMGLSLGESTIENKLKEIKDALESRKK